MAHTSNEGGGPDAVVRPFYRDAMTTTDPRDSSSTHPMSGLHPDLIVARDWPRRCALVFGESPDPAVPAVLHKFGFATAVTTSTRAQRVAAALGPFTLLVLTADALEADDAVTAIRQLHAHSPSARVLLVRPSEPLSAEVMLRALRVRVNDVVDVAAGALERAIADELRAAGLTRERVLAVGAHPDDVEIGCAGALLDHRLRGDRVTVLTLSRGAVGGDTQQRVEESLASADAIGAQLILGDLPDAHIDDGYATIRLIESVVQAIDPTVIYVHSAHDQHQDHRAVASATASAARGVRRIFAFQSPSATDAFTPTQFVPVDAVLQRKISVLRLFTSQSARSYVDPELLVAASRYWARHLGANARYAEPFEVIRSVGDLRQSVGVPSASAGWQPEFAISSFSTSYDAGYEPAPFDGTVQELA